MKTRSSTRSISALVAVAAFAQFATATEPPTTRWEASPALFAPFWQGDTMTGESALFLKDAEGGKARASTLFPIERLLEIRNADGDTVYAEGRDYTWRRDSREIVLPTGSRIVSSAPEDLRAPHDSQKYKLTHRDGKSEILFGAKLEYHALQASITYTHKPGLWPLPAPHFDEKALPLTIAKLRQRLPARIVVLGDSISTGRNASGWAQGAPFQPAYPELLELSLQSAYKSPVELANLSVNGKNARWGANMIDKIIAEKPDLVVVAFGMNDAAGRSKEDFRKDLESIIGGVRKGLPESEFILVAGMLGNADWPRLNQASFGEFRDAMTALCKPGVALANLTSVWGEFLKWKKFSDLTGNGVNHPNDFGHRVYAQVIGALLIPED